MEQKKFILSVLCGTASIILTLALLYSANSTTYECVSIAGDEFNAVEIVERNSTSWGKKEDGTLIQIQQFKEVNTMNFAFYLLLGIVIYIVLNVLIYKFASQIFFK